jgi:hypothetical protein
MVVDAAARANIISYMDRLSARFTTLLQVQPVQTDLVLTTTNCGFNGGVPVDQTPYPNTDLVLFVTARPAPTGASDSNAIATAGGCSFDQKGRSVGGQVNVNPANFIPMTDDIAKFAVLTHEVTHALGFSSSSFPSYLDENGNVRSNPTVQQTRSYNGGTQTVTYLATPAVVTAAQAQFSCSSLVGGELEDQGGSGTAGSHWKMRVFFGEVMMGAAQFPNPMKGPSYSALTLAALQDSGWYMADLTKAEFLEWGYQQGCSIPSDRCENWVYNSGATYTSGYFCNTNGEEDCTFNHVYQGVCTVSTYQSSLGFFAHFSDNTQGGYLQYMDYCPVTVGYSNGDCRVAANAPTPTAYYTDQGANFGATNSRCYRSNLLKTASGYSQQSSGEFRCYLTYCVGGNVIVQIGGANYTCPTGGGPIAAVSGYKGYINCPSYLAICSDTTATTTAAPTTAGPTTSAGPTTTAAPTTPGPITTAGPTTTTTAGPTTTVDPTATTTTTTAASPTTTTTRAPTAPPATVLGLSTLTAYATAKITVLGSNLDSVDTCRFTNDASYDFEKKKFSSMPTRVTIAATCSSGGCICTVPKLSLAQNQVVFVELMQLGTVVHTVDGNVLTFSYVDPSLIATKFALNDTTTVMTQFSDPVSDLNLATAFDPSAIQVTNAFGSNQLVISTPVDASNPARQAMIASTEYNMAGQAISVQFRATVSNAGDYGHIVELSLLSVPHTKSNYRFVMSVALEQSQRYLYVVYNSTDEYTVKRTSCSYADNTLYRLQIEIVEPTKAGTGYRVRGLLTSTSSGTLCELVYKPYGFKEAAFIASTFRVGISQSNIVLAVTPDPTDDSSGFRRKLLQSGPTSTMTASVSDVSVGCSSSSCTSIPPNTLAVVIATVSVFAAALIITVVAVLVSLLIYYKFFRTFTVNKYIGTEDMNQIKRFSAANPTH